MKVFLVFAHPLKSGSFNHALKEIAEEELSPLHVSDLYAMKFKSTADWDDFLCSDLPLQYTQAQKEAFSNHCIAQDIAREQEKLLWCDLLILQFPLWWFSAPAILKGWIDRVLSKGFAYDKGKWFDQGLMRGKKAMLALTTQSGESNYSPNGVHGPIEHFLKPIHHTLKLVGFEVESPFVAYEADGGTDALRQATLTRYRTDLKKLTLPRENRA